MADSRLPPLPELAAFAEAAGLGPAAHRSLLFRDPRSVGLLAQAERIARSDASVLVIGETGTGKELIARHLHKRSGRKGPFVAVNCGAFSESLIDAELFGHESGAFTGANHARAGWFEAANGGTLFLDEIGDLPLAMQVKLLRVLQERQVVRIGSRRSIAVDVRLIAATNVDLKAAVEAQRFRADLYYRLNVAAIQLPALRERPGDILPLAEHFLQRYGERLDLRHAALSADAREALLQHPWPGNIRELENVIHFALIVSRQGLVQARDLRLIDTLGPAPADAAQAAASSPPAGSELPPDPLASPPQDAAPAAPTDALLDTLQQAFGELLAHRLPDLFQQVESALVHAAYARSGQNQVRSARALGITRNTLRTLLKRHGLLADGGRGEDGVEDGDAVPAH